MYLPPEEHSSPGLEYVNYLVHRDTSQMSVPEKFEDTMKYLSHIISDGWTRGAQVASILNKEVKQLGQEGSADIVKINKIANFLQNSSAIKLAAEGDWNQFEEAGTTLKEIIDKQTEISPTVTEHTDATARKHAKTLFSNDISELYESGKQYLTDRPELAFACFKRASEMTPKNDQEKMVKNAALVSLGNLYYEGRGTEQSYEKAFKSYASTKDDMWGNAATAYMYRHGQGVRSNVAKNILHENEAIKLGYPRSFINDDQRIFNMEDAIVYCKGDRYPTLLHLVRSRNEELDTDKAHYAIASILEKKFEQGKETDEFINALEHYQLAALKGSGDAIGELQRLSKTENMYTGQVHAKLASIQQTKGNAQEAISHYREAALRGSDITADLIEMTKRLSNPEERKLGLRELYTIYSEGLGRTPKNKDSATEILGHLALLDDPEAIEKLEALANQGNYEAHNQLGDYWEEKGDLNQAIDHYVQAQAQPFGHGKAFQGEARARDTIHKLFESQENPFKNI
jgi:TPR repeat protein